MWFALYTRIALTAAVVGLSVWQFIEGNIGNGIFIILLAMVVSATIFMNEMMLLAFLQMRKSNFEKADGYLNKIKKPELMLGSQEAYYYFLKGTIISHIVSPGKAESFFKKALSKGLRFKHDQAMAKLSLAGIAATRRRKREALNWLNEAKKLDDKKMLSDQIKMMKQQLGRI
ncbi:MAG: hypothetical protein CL843_14330 [Crocinitomicaceae bacterium]|nr:hypothetical protein [Crocinitomicaceae bacterium]|tara:strand:- start:45 stop:563 length:519 start_codon:yes stop_codon:yes gene_type:complete